MKTIKLICVGGGSGGHVTPIFPVIEALRDQVDVEVTMVVDKDFYDATKGMIDSKGYDIDLRTMSSGCLRRYSNFTWLDYLKQPSIIWRNFKDLFRIAAGFIESFWLLREPVDVVFSKGGFVSLPLGVVAGWKKIPLVIHDSDARPGLTNRVLQRYATRIATGTPVENYPYPKDRTKHTGVPIDKKFFSPIEASQAKRTLGLSQKPMLLLVGGSLGAKSLNEALARDAESILDLGYQIIHVTGQSGYDEVLLKATHHADYKVIPFLYKDMDTYFAASDLVISRASATVIQELSAMKKTVIIVPAKQLGDQLKNAVIYQESGSALVLQDDDLSESGSLARVVQELKENPARAQAFADELAHYAKPDAAKHIAQMIIDVIKEEK